MNGMNTFIDSAIQMFVRRCEQTAALLLTLETYSMSGMMTEFTDCTFSWCSSYAPKKAQIITALGTPFYMLSN
jgi:hypothetical protein